MIKEELREEPGCMIWRVTDDAEKTVYEVKCGIHKLVQFDSFAAAVEYFDRWAPEVSKEIDLFEG